MMQTSLRYPNELIAPRVARLKPYLQEQNKGVTISDSKVKLIALLQGLDALEAYFGITETPA